MSQIEKDLDEDTYIGVGFPLNHNSKGFFSRTKTALHQTKSNIKNLLLTKKGERLGNPLFGSDVTGSLFDFVDFGTASVIQSQIEVSISNFEPRVDNVRVEVYPRPDNNEFEVNVIFDIIGQEFPTQEYTFLLEATR